MSAEIIEINRRYLRQFDKLLAASSTIIRLERMLDASKRVILKKNADIDALFAICEGCIAMLEAVRPVLPDEVKPNLEHLLSRSKRLMAMVKAL